VNLILWDLAGEDDINTFRMTNMRKPPDVLVADGNAAPTLDVALSSPASRLSTVRCRRLL
jgi:hypothetical protein